MTPEQRFDKLNGFKGFGNPEGKKKICFIGIEEASGLSEVSIDNLDKEILSLYNNEIRIEPECDYYEYKRQWEKDNKPDKYTRVYEYMAKIIRFLKTELSEKEILDKYLFTDKGFAFQMNLYPLGKKRANEVNEDITNPLRFGLSSEKEYRKKVHDIRFPILRSYRENHKNNFAITICFGKTYWDDFSLLLNLQNKANEDLGCLKYYQDDNIMLTKFFKSGNGCLNKVEMLKISNIFVKHQIQLQASML